MSNPAAIPFTWDGESMVPKPGFARKCDAIYVVGEVYRLEPCSERSTATHNHEFAWLKEAWQNLPESLAEIYATPDHLRKRALIVAGFYDEMIVDAGSNAAALRFATMLRAIDEFAFVVVRGPLVARRTAKSQSRRAMDRETFQRSKTAIMDVIAEMVGVTPKQLATEAGRAA